MTPTPPSWPGAAPWRCSRRQSRKDRAARATSALGARHAIQDHFFCFGSVAPAHDLDPFAGFEILVMGEEMLDLLQGDLGQVAVIDNAVEALGDMGGRNRDDFLVH